MTGPVVSREGRFLSLTVLFEGVLMMATWPLWVPVRSFPWVPCFRSLAGMPTIVDCVLGGVLILTILRLTWCLTRNNGAIGGNASSSGNTDCGLRDSVPVIGLSLFSAAALALLNQQRLQPWHWLFILVMTQTLVLPSAERIRLYRLTVASIYLFAAVSRLGSGVSGGMNRQVVTMMLGAVGAEQILRQESILFAVCLTVTLGELATGFLLLMPRTRGLGMIAAVLVHATLVLVLSPLGLNHHPGVLIWNVYFLMAVPVLFGSTRKDPEVDQASSSSQRLSRQARLLAAFVFLFPLSGLFGFADNWLSWQVYSPRPEVVRVFVRQAARDDLPADMRNFIAQPALLDDWCPVRIDRWSLAVAKAPLYPEDRFQLAVAAYLMSFSKPSSIRVDLESPDAPAWWNRTTVRLDDRQQIDSRLRANLLNGTATRNTDR